MRDTGCVRAFLTHLASRIAHPGITLPYRYHLVNPQIREQLHPALGPDYWQRVDAGCAAKPKVLAIVHRGHEATVRRVIQILPSAAGRQRERGAESAAGRGFTLEHHGRGV